MDSAILREWFDRVDSARTGSITTPQLKNALAVGNLDLPLSVVQQMIRMYDFDKNGTMSFEEFVALNQFLLKIQQAFSDLERNRGFLLHDEVYEALMKLGFSLDSPAFYTACESFDQKKNGMFRLDAFISLCVFIQSARNLFNSFDTNKQGRVTLDLNQFIYCSIMESSLLEKKYFGIGVKAVASKVMLRNYVGPAAFRLCFLSRLRIVEYETSITKHSPCRGKLVKSEVFTANVHQTGSN